MTIVSWVQHCRRDLIAGFMSGVSHGMATCNERQRNSNARRRSAYILVLVMGVTAVVTSLGFAYLEAQSTVMPEAINRCGSVRAQYLAESGVAVAKHFLMYPPNGTAVGAYFSGASGLGIDASSDFVNIATAQDGTDPYIYDIKALGIAHSDDGSTRGKYGVACKVLLPEDPVVKIGFALLGNRLFLPPGLIAEGKIHGNGEIVSYAWCRSPVRSTSWIWWGGSGMPTSYTQNAPAFTMPTKDPTKYKEYRLHGQRFMAYTGWTQKDFKSANATDLNKLDWSATNPGRLMFVNGDLDLYDNVRFEGTLLVTGKVTIKGWNVKVTAQPGFPAIVANGEIRFESSWTSLQTIGSVLCSQVNGRNKDDIFLSVEGAFVVYNSDGFIDCWNADTFTFTYNAERAKFLNVLATVYEEPITVLEWKENG